MIKWYSVPGALLVVMLFCCTERDDKKAHTQSYTIVIKNMKFEPATLRVNKGDTVIWINNDFVDHDITEEKSKAWSSGVLSPGKKWSKVIDQSDAYFCSIHVVMKGNLELK